MLSTRLCWLRWIQGLKTTYIGSGLLQASGSPVNSVETWVLDSDDPDYYENTNGMSSWALNLLIKQFTTAHSTRPQKMDSVNLDRLGDLNAI